MLDQAEQNVIGTPKSRNCKVCKKVLPVCAVRAHMETHVFESKKRTTLKIKPRCCRVCKRFVLRKSVRSHLESHLFETKYAKIFPKQVPWCAVCLKKFPNQYGARLPKHVRIHLFERNKYSRKYKFHSVSPIQPTTVRVCKLCGESITSIYQCAFVSHVCTHLFEKTRQKNHPWNLQRNASEEKEVCDYVVTTIDPKMLAIHVQACQHFHDFKHE